MLSTSRLQGLKKALLEARQSRVKFISKRWWNNSLRIKGSKPTGIGVYVITDLKDRKVYVGSAKNLWRRYQTHCSRLGHLTSLEELRTRWIFRVIKTCATRAESYEIERNVIRRLKPNLTTNKALYRQKTYYIPTGKPRGRPRKVS